MQTFAVIILIVVIIAVTHVHNWVTRGIFENSSDEGTIAAFIAVIFIYAIAMFFAFKYLIIWAYPLIN